MRNIKKVDIKSSIVTGLQTHTKNANEMNPKTQKIVPMWERFFMFPIKGEFPQAIIDTCIRVWAYFVEPSIDEKEFMRQTLNSTSLQMKWRYIGTTYSNAV